MPAQSTIRLARPIAAVRVAAGAGGGVGPNGNDAPPALTAEDLELEVQRRVQAERAQLQAACQALMEASCKLQEFRGDLVKDAESQLVDLATGIARKILMQEIQAGRHEIEAIVREALAHVPQHQDVVVHLNPEDWANCPLAQQAEGEAPPEHVRFVADPEIGRAECVVETPEGIVESTLDANLSEIGLALKATE